MENEKQVFLQLSKSQLKILERGLDCVLVCGRLYNTQKRKAEKLQERIIKILNENKGVKQE